MEAIAQLQDTDIPKILAPTIAAFVPLLQPKRDEIALARKTFRYGATDRHQLDVYYPPSNGKKHPLLIFAYGGGFVSGARTLPAPAELGYGNLGLYFSQRGFVTIIPDYRLAPGTTFPGPVEDVRDALAWAVANPKELGLDADVENAFVMGHSAGGVHVLTLLLSPTIKSGLKTTIKGGIIVSAPFNFDDKNVDIATVYYGSAEAVKTHNPVALLGALSREEIDVVPPLILIQCPRDPEWFLPVSREFQAAAKERGVKPAPVEVMAEGHNHLSVTWALNSGEGEKWAEEVVNWMESL